MLTLFHAPQSRSVAIAQLVHELGIADQVEIRVVTIPRMDGSGGRDPANPHPEGKVPFLTDGTDTIRERGACILYLTDRFPQSGLGRAVGDPQRGEYLSWLFWYQGVLEPVLLVGWDGLNSPAVTASLGDSATALARLDEVLKRQPYLLGQDYSAVDLLCASPFAWMGDKLPATPAIADWVARCQDRDAVRAAREL